MKSIGKGKNHCVFEDDCNIFWYNYDLNDQKDYNKAIMRIKVSAQKSLEYDVWQAKTKINEEICPVCNAPYTYVKADTHHHPLTITSVIENIMDELIMSNVINDHSFLEVVQLVMAKHLQNKIDYIVLCNHCHEKYHANDPEVMVGVNEAFKRLKDENNKG